MKKISILLCLIIAFSFCGCSMGETISVNEAQKAKVEELYQFAQSVSEIEVYGADHPYYLSQIKLYKKNNTEYYGFSYYDKTVSNAIRENGGGVTTLRAVEHTYKNQNGWLVRCDGEISSNYAVTESAAWSSSNTYEEQMQQLYRIAQYL